MFRKAVSWVTKLWDSFSGTHGSVRIEHSHPDRPDFVYTLESPFKYNALCASTNAGVPIYVEYSLPNIYRSSGESFDEFLAYYQIVELEELVHAAGVNNVEPDHSEKWLPVLMESVMYPKEEYIQIYAYGEVHEYDPYDIQAEAVPEEIPADD